MIEKLKKITSAHWLLMFGILFAFIGGHWSSDSSLVSHLGLTASIVSIVLALIAIFYTIERKGSAEEQIGRMNGILRNLEGATGRLEEKGEAVHKVTQSLLSSQKTELSIKKTEPTEEAMTPPELPPDLEEQLSTTSPLGLVCLNWIVKAKSSIKASSLKVIQEQLSFGKGTVDYLRGYFVGTSVNLFEMNISADDDSLVAEEIPSGFEELLNKTIEKQSKYLEKKNSKVKDVLKRWLELTDKYFNDKE